MDAGAAALAPVFTLTGTAAVVRRRLDELAADPSGVTELAYQPAGPDIPRELRAFAAAAGLDPAG
jgi:5,10-methylenetetrahydromethanopterin reductase